MKTITEYGHDGKKHEFVLLSEYEKLEKKIAELKVIDKAQHEALIISEKAIKSGLESVTKAHLEIAELERFIGRVIDESNTVGQITEHLFYDLEDILTKH